MSYVLRPSGDTDLSNATIHNEAELPQSITGLAAGTYEIGRVSWSAAAVTVTEIPTPVVVTAPAIAGTGKIGSPQTATPAVWTTNPAQTERRWRADDADLGQTTTSYTPTGADDRKTLTYEERARMDGGTWSAWSASSGLSVTHVAPVTSGSLAASSLTQNSGVRTRDVSSGFTGQALIFSIVSPRAGVTISDAGVVSIDTAATGVLADVTITVSATNSGGQAASGFALTVAAEAPAVVIAPAISGAPTVGQTLSVSQGTWTRATSHTYQWTRNGTAISGATAATHVLTESNEGGIVGCRVTAIGAGGSTSVNATGAQTVVHVAPTVVGRLSNLNLVRGVQMTAVNATSVFVGQSMTYALAPASAPLPAGLTLSSTGTLSGSPTVTSSALDIVVRATNSGGFADTSFILAVAASSDTTAPAAIANSIGPQDVAGDVLVSITGLSENAPNSRYVLTASQQRVLRSADVVAGRDETGAAAAASGAVSLMIPTSSISSALPSGLHGNYYLYLTLGDAASNYSSPLEFGPVDIDTTAPTIRTWSPADKATGVPLNSSIQIDFDKDLNSNGTLLLRMLGGAEVERFDLTSGAGSGGGVARLSSARSTTDRLVIVPGANLLPSTTYCLHCIGLRDRRGNLLQDITTDSTYTITSMAASLAPTIPLTALHLFESTNTTTSHESGSFQVVGGRPLLITVRYYNEASASLATWSDISIGAKGRPRGAGAGLGSHVHGGNGGRICAQSWLHIPSRSESGQTIQATASGNLRALSIEIAEVNVTKTVPRIAAVIGGTSGTSRTLNITGAQTGSLAIFVGAVDGGLGPGSWTNVGGELPATSTGPTQFNDVQGRTGYTLMTSGSNSGTFAWARSGNNVSYALTLG